MRRKRMQIFFELIATFPEPVRILDVGGTVDLWRTSPMPGKLHVTLLNLTKSPTVGVENIISLVGDARKMPEFPDNSFDVCFSNSVIEHVGTLYDQIAMAKEIRRVSKAYFVQTPARNFPIEPHFLVPGWQYLPIRLRAWMLQQRKVGWAEKFSDPLLAQAEVEQIRLLTRREMEMLFPDANIYEEKVGPFTKSIVVFSSKQN
jgi:hypothetical protein